MTCRNCGLTQPIALAYVCPACFGPLEVTYDLDVVAATLSREAIARRAPGIWRYLELLPVDAAPARSLPVGSTPLLDCRPAGPDPRRRPAVAQGRHPQPLPELQGPSGRDRRGPGRGVRRAGPRLRLDRQPRRRDGRRGGRGRAARPTCSSRPTSSRPRSITRWPTARRSCPIDGTYDDVNRLCLEVADETGWGFVNINLRPFYAEGSKTLAYEIAESLGWRTPDVIVGPVASGAMFTRVARGFEELAELGLVERRPIRFVGGQAAGCAPGRDGLGGRHRRHHAGPRARHDRPLAGDRQPGRRSLRGRGRARQRRLDRGDPGRGRPRRRSATSRGSKGSIPETAGGVTLGAVAAARRRGVIRDGDEVVALLTGNGLKTPDARTLGLPDGGTRRPGPASPASRRSSARA